MSYDFQPLQHAELEAFQTLRSELKKPQPACVLSAILSLLVQCGMHGITGDYISVLSSLDQHPVVINYWNRLQSITVRSPENRVELKKKSLLGDILRHSRFLGPNGMEIAVGMGQKIQGQVPAPVLRNPLLTVLLYGLKFNPFYFYTDNGALEQNLVGLARTRRHLLINSHIYPIYSQPIEFQVRAQAQAAAQQQGQGQGQIVDDRIAIAELLYEGFLLIGYVFMTNHRSVVGALVDKGFVGIEVCRESLGMMMTHAYSFFLKFVNGK